MHPKQIAASWWLGAALALAPAAPTAAQAAPTRILSAADARIGAAVDRVAAKALADHAAAGFAVAVLRDGRVLHAKGYGAADLEHRVPVTADTVFRVGSITKEFTAAAELGVPEYRIAEDGPDHLKVFTATAVVAGRDLGSGDGRTKKEAEQKVAELAWRTLTAETATGTPTG